MRQRKPAEYHNLPINLTLSCKTPLFNKSHKSDIRSEFYGGVRVILFYSSHCENRLSLSTNRLHSVLGIAYILYRIASFTAELGGHGQEFGHELVSESVSEADSDSDTRFFETSDADSSTDSDTRVRPTLLRMKIFRKSQWRWRWMERI